MAITAFEIDDLTGEYVDGPARLDTEVDVALEELGDRIVLTQTARHPATPDRAVRGELTKADARQLQRELDRLLED
jgi:hypothetical protein